VFAGNLRITIVPLAGDFAAQCSEFLLAEKVARKKLFLYLHALGPGKHGG
jgi:hypothetical protein